MECEVARELYAEALAAQRPAPPELEHHTAGCDACRGEMAGLAAVWAAIAALPVLGAPPAVARAIRRRVRWEAAREALTAIDAWQRGALAGVSGFVVSVVLSLLVPYETMVAVCQTLVRDAVPAPGAYLVAGLVYGLVPMLIAALLEGHAVGVPRLVGGLETILVFLVVLVPYVLLRCGEFPAALLAGFLGGIALGAVAGEAVSLGLRGGATIEGLPTPW